MKYHLGSVSDPLPAKEIRDFLRHPVNNYSFCI